MLNEFLALFLGAFDALIGREFPEWYLLRGILAVVALCLLLAFALACIWLVVRALVSWLRPAGGGSHWE